MAPGFSPTGLAHRWTITYQPGVPAPAPKRNTIMVSALNVYRENLGEAAVTWSAALARAALAHAEYLARNGYNRPSFHEESRGHAGFTGVMPWDRDLAMGWANAYTGEVGIEWSRVFAAPVVIADLVNTVYHRLALLTPELCCEGGGETQGNTGAELMDLGYSYPRDLPLAVVYPYPGQIGVPTGWVDIESPNPVPNGFGREMGYPITLEFPTVERLAHTQVALYANYAPVAGILDRPGSNGMATNQVGFVPRQPLFPGTRYTVEVSTQARFNSGFQTSIHRSWQFATGDSAASVTAAKTDAQQLLVVVDLAGWGKPIGGIRVVVRRWGQSRIVASGVTDSHGQVTITMPRSSPKRHRYWVSDAEGTGIQIWW